VGVSAVVTCRSRDCTFEHEPHLWCRQSGTGWLVVSAPDDRDVGLARAGLGADGFRYVPAGDGDVRAHVCDLQSVQKSRISLRALHYDNPDPRYVVSEFDD